MIQAKGKTWGLLLRVTAALTLIPVAQTGWGAMPQAHAAEPQKGGMTKDEAIQWAKKWVTIPNEYKLEHSSYLDERKEFFFGKPVWRLNWQKEQDGFISVTIDAATGSLLQFSHYGKEREKEASRRSISAEQALERAEQFLRRVAQKEEMEKLSKPNQYPETSLHSYPQAEEHAFSFTRVENGIPFLENGFRIVVGASGQIVDYQREWYEGRLPAAKTPISIEQAERLMAEKVKPSLAYARIHELAGDYGASENRYSLVYQYNERDAQLIDAVSGKPLNLLGEPVEQQVSAKALGTTVRAKQTDSNIITKEEAQKIAEQIIKKLPGSYRSDGSTGGGASTGPDGVTRRNWKFDFTPQGSPDKNPEPVVLRIGDRGELVEYRANDRFFHEEGRAFEKAVPWEQARDNAVKLVSRLFDDRLGEIYLIESTPSEESLKEIRERGRRYSIPFGWMKDGIPVTGLEFHVDVNPETGEVESLRVRDEEIQVGDLDAPAGKAIDADAAKKVEQEQKKLTLVYFLPQRWRFDIPSGKKEPLLVYRHIGDRGVVDAVTGKWVSFDQLRQKKTPQDIADHPAKEALLFAVNSELLTVKDGKLEPDKPLTRGEMAVMMARMSDRIEFHGRFRTFYDDEEESKPYLFADVDQKHPQYAAIQKCLQIGLIPKEGKRFEPDRAITRGEAAEFAVRLLGYEKLLSKQEIFVSPYQDVEKKLTPAAALAHAFGLFETKAASFEPGRPMTRAEAAQLLHTLQKTGDQE